MKLYASPMRFQKFVTSIRRNGTKDSVLLKDTKKPGGLVFEVIGLTYEVPEVRNVDKVLAASSHVMPAIGKEVCITAYFGRAQSCRR